MSRSSACKLDRGQVEPLPALVAVLALTLALVAYGNLAAALPPTDDANAAVPALKRVEAAATSGATLDPAALDPGAARMDGYRVNVTLRTEASVVSVGPAPGNDAESASVHVAVDDDTRIRPGILHVEVWPWTAA